MVTEYDIPNDNAPIGRGDAPQEDINVPEYPYPDSDPENRTIKDVMSDKAYQEYSDEEKMLAAQAQAERLARREEEAKKNWLRQLRGRFMAGVALGAVVFGGLSFLMPNRTMAPRPLSPDEQARTEAEYHEAGVSMNEDFVYEADGWHALERVPPEPAEVATAAVVGATLGAAAGVASSIAERRREPQELEQEQAPEEIQA